MFAVADEACQQTTGGSPTVRGLLLARMPDHGWSSLGEVGRFLGWEGFWMVAKVREESLTTPVLKQGRRRLSSRKARACVTVWKGAILGWVEAECQQRHQNRNRTFAPANTPHQPTPVTDAEDLERNLELRKPVWLEHSPSNDRPEACPSERGAGHPRRTSCLQLGPTLLGLMGQTFETTDCSCVQLSHQKV